MGSLLQPHSGEHHLLSGRTLIGRAPRCALVIPSRRVSGEHAVIYWSEQRWWLRDLGSRNGSWVDGDRVDPATPLALSAGQSIVFGGADPWSLHDPQPPQAYARRGDGLTRQASGGLLLLPDERDPQLTAWFSSDEGWLAETETERWPLTDGATVMVDGAPWQLALPTGLDATLDAHDAPLAMHTLTLRFAVSRDEEHVTAEASHAGGRLDLGARAHHYLLLTLARQHLADAALPPSERGWVDVDQLIRGLRMEPRTLRVQIYRARQQLSEAGVLDAASLIERRLDAGQLRLGVQRVEVTLA